MESLKDFRRACGVGAAAVLVAAVAHAQPSDKRTSFTFSRPITLPGVTLPAGKYIFRLTDDQTSRKVIQVVSSDGTKPYAMLLTIPNERRDPAKDAEVAFLETASRTPSAVRAWWYPGERTGYEFIYPRAQARQLAQTTGELQRTAPQVAPPSSPSQNSVPNPPRVARNTLPQTASQLPLAGLIGMLSLVAFSSVRPWRTDR